MHCPELHLLPPPPPGKTGWPWTKESHFCQKNEITEQWPRITIVTPSFNQGQFLEETIRSILLQGYSNLEYIIIDGGSSDNSIEIIRKYNQWIAYWVSEPDRGQTEAINKGFKMATGDILAWLNSDDVYMQNALKKIGKSFLAYPKVDIVYGGTIFVSENGALIKKVKIFPFNRYNLFIRNIIPQPSTFFRKRLFDETGPLNETLQLCFDVEFWRKAAIKTNFRFINDFISFFRFYANSKSAYHSLKMKKEDTEVTVDILEKIHHNDIRFKQILRFRYLQLAILCWKTGESDTKIKYYVFKASIDEDLFINYYIQQLISAFTDITYLDVDAINRNYTTILKNDVTAFFNSYFRQYLPTSSEKYLSYLTSHCYLTCFVKKYDFYFLFKGIIESPRYFFYFLFQAIGEILLSLSPMFFNIAFFFHFDFHLSKLKKIGHSEDNERKAPDVQR